MGKRIEDLPVYGSYDLDKMLSDIFEVSKNSGPSGAPIYASDGSRKIKFSEMVNLIGLTKTFVPTLTNNYIIVTCTDDQAANGAVLRIAMAYAKTVPRDASTRFAILLSPGVYDLGANGLVEYEGFNNYIDFIGIGDKRNVSITSSDIRGTLGSSATADYKLKNLSIGNTGGGPSIMVWTYAFTTDYGKWIDLDLYAGTTADIDYAGWYEYITCYDDNVMPGNILGTVKNSTFQNSSCGYKVTGDAVISGTIENCSGGTNCFNTTNATGKLINCIRTGGQNLAVHLGTIDRCTFSENDAAIDAIRIGAGAIVKNSTIYQAGAADTISAAGAVAASIYLCAMNKAENVLITNNIATPNNVVDTDIII